MNKKQALMSDKDDENAKTKALLAGSINRKNLLNVDLSADIWISRFYVETALYNSTYNE